MNDVAYRKMNVNFDGKCQIMKPYAKYHSIWGKPNKKTTRAYLWLFVIMVAFPVSAAELPYLDYVRSSLDILLEHGTDRYGKTHAPIFVSILDVMSRNCPREPAALDEAYRVTRRDRRNPAGANLLTDQPLIDVLHQVSNRTGDWKYAKAADAYIAYYLEHLADEKGLIWWGWHRHYDVFTDKMTGHSGNHHEIHAIHDIYWDRLWAVNPDATRKEIEACWRWHVIDKGTGEINRHGDGRRGCDFAMSSASFIDAFAFLYGKTGDRIWLERARLLEAYYYNRRNPDTDLFPDRPNAGIDRFDGGAFVTSITGCYCRGLMNAWQRSGEDRFLERAADYLLAYDKYAYDEETGKYFGALKLDGTVIPGPRTVGDYAQYEPRGHLNLWEPYVAGYQYPLYTAQAYARACALTKRPELLTAAKRFAGWLNQSPPGAVETAKTWYSPYTDGPGKQGTYAGKYGRAILFYLQLYELTGKTTYLARARKAADQAIEKLYVNGLFKGHPAKPYYEAIDGVGFLLQALIALDGRKNN